MLKKTASSTRMICRAGIIAALYVLLTVFFQPFSFGILQLRVSEALTVLPLIFPESIPALFVGCLISNILGNGVYDIIIGSLATLFAAALTFFTTRKIKSDYLKILVGGIFPVILNALAVPFIFILCGGEPQAYVVNALIIAAEEAGVVYTLGTLLYFAIKKTVLKYMKNND